MRRTAVAVVVAAALFSVSLTSRPREPASSAASSPYLLFNGGFETGSYKPFHRPQCANYGQAPSLKTFGNFFVVQSPVGEGADAGRFDLPADTTRGTRCELLAPRTLNLGGDDYYTLMLYLPRGWKTSASDATGFWGVEIAQLNFEILWGPTIALQAHDSHVTLALQTGVCAQKRCQWSSNADNVNGHPSLPPLHAIPAKRMRFAAWNELIIHAHWATDSTGIVEVWHRIKGQTAWRKTASLHGYPTVQVNPDGSYPIDTIDKIGAYRGPSTAPTSVWLDGFSRSGSFAAAAAHLP
jgi:hypothetical protein